MKHLMEKAREVKKDERGLTLVELLAVVVILAIVAAIAFVLIGNVIDNSKKDAHIANAQQIVSAVKLAEASNDVVWDADNKFDVFPADSDDLGSFNTLGDVLDPWDKVKYKNGVVEKVDTGDYKVTLVLETPASAKCGITNKTEEDLQKGRGKGACDEDQGEGS